MPPAPVGRVGLDVEDEGPVLPQRQPQDPDPLPLVFQHAEQHALGVQPLGEQHLVIAAGLGVRVGLGHAPLHPGPRVVLPLVRLPAGELLRCHGPRPAARGQAGRGVAERLGHGAVAQDVAERRREAGARLGLTGNGRLHHAAAPAACHLLGGERGHRAAAAPAVRPVDAQLVDHGHRVAEVA